MTWTDAAVPFAGTAHADALPRARSAAPSQTDASAPLALRGVSLSFGGVAALRNVDLAFGAGVLQREDALGDLMRRAE